MDSMVATRRQRDDLMKRYWDAVDESKRLMDEEQFDEADIILEASYAVEKEYLRRLPRLVLSCCPICEKPLYRSFDPCGLDGLWWRPKARPSEPPSCPHFCCLVGAVGYQGKERRSGRFTVRPGPEVPYVIPRLLEHPGMIAVIGDVPLDPGYRTWPIAYFAKSRPAVEELTAGWAREIFSYTTPLGEFGTKLCNDPWDFELLPWVESGKIRWCPPGARNARLSEAPVAKFPYAQVTGVRARIAIQGERSWTEGLPEGNLPDDYLPVPD